MQNKKRLHRHLLLIYIIYFAALIVGFAASFVPDFSRGWRDAQDTLEIEIPQGGIRSYYVSAPVVRKAAEPVVIEGLPASIEPTISRIDLRVQVDEAYTLGNAFKVMGNNVYCYLLMVITGLSYLTILVLIALIINSLRKSIRDEQPLRHSNIVFYGLVNFVPADNQHMAPAQKFTPNVNAVLVFGRNGITQEMGKIENRTDWGKTGFIDFAAVHRRLINDSKLAAFPDGCNVGKWLFHGEAPFSGCAG